MGSNIDLRKHMESDAVALAFGKLISGKSNYRAVIERRVEKIYCSGCRKQLEGEEKFCPECGTKVIKPEQLISQQQQTQPLQTQPPQTQPSSENQTQNQKENQQTLN